MAEKLQKPGERAERSGQYEMVGARGARTGVERTATLGERLPPTDKPGQRYRLADATKNGAGRGKK